LSILLTIMGLAISYNYDLPAGATIILLAGFVFLAALGWKGIFSRLRN
jgi:ABC-type Mn2+/Zn2+ transport system permease subunit